MRYREKEDILYYTENHLGWWATKQPDRRSGRGNWELGIGCWSR